MKDVVKYANHIFYGENMNESDLNVKHIINTDISETDIDTINDISARIAVCDNIQKTFIVSYMLRKRSDKMFVVFEPYRSIIKANCNDILREIVVTIKESPYNEHRELTEFIDSYLKTIIVTSTTTIS